MKMGLSDKEGAALHNLLEDVAGDMVIKLNAQGFIEHGSDSLTMFGLDIAQMLLPPHIAELADSEYSGQVSRHFECAMRDENWTGWIEFKVKGREPEPDCQESDRGGWYALSLRRLTTDTNELIGALGLLRSIERVRSLEDELFATALTDPLTGLVNRQVFLARLRDELVEGTGGYLAVLSIDRMRALFVQFGQRAADEINWGFAKFLQTMALPGSELAQIDGDRFAVLLPGMECDDARNWSNDLLDTLSSLALPASGRSPQITASAGLARIENTVDWSMRQAELALIMAQAGGGSRLAQCSDAASPSMRTITANCNSWDDELGERSIQR